MDFASNQNLHPLNPKGAAPKILTIKHHTGWYTLSMLQMQQTHFVNSVCHPPEDPNRFPRNPNM
jgi:hypothetical protein